MSFVDTNILVYSSALGAPLRDKARAALAGFGTLGQVAISRQIMREYVAVMTRSQTWAKPLPVGEAFNDTSSFARRFEVLEDGPVVWSELAALSEGYVFGGKQVHDANIVATMLAYGKTRLLTFNEADFRRFERLIEIVVPS